jgi:hypothetical protein
MDLQTYWCPATPLHGVTKPRQTTFLHLFSSLDIRKHSRVVAGSKE